VRRKTGKKSLVQFGVKHANLSPDQTVQNPLS
jgi:hypothetical protein